MQAGPRPWSNTPIARHPAGGFEAPYVIGLLRTTEDVTLFAPIVGETEGLAPGEEFEFVTVPHAGGDVGFAYKARRNASR